MNAFLFLTYSGITGFIEIGSVIYAIMNEYSVTQALLLVVAYQLGCFFPTNIKLNKGYIIIFAGLSVVFSIITSFFYFSFWLMLFSIMFLSPCLQIIRSVQKGKISIAKKRAFRILGFAISPLFCPIVLLTLCLITLVICCIYVPKSKSKINLSRLNTPYIIMVVHQMHYFSYAYMVLFLAMEIDTFSGFLTSGMFVLGWITYTLVSYILNNKNYALYFLIGHSYLTIILCFMAFATSIPLKLFFWILTGLGGGTVFCIKNILKLHNNYDEKMLETSENYGHMVGLICGIFVFRIFDSINAVVMFAGTCAAFAVFMMLIYLFSQKRGGTK